jgi:hypothetical protein
MSSENMPSEESIAQDAKPFVKEQAARHMVYALVNEGHLFNE